MNKQIPNYPRLLADTSLQPAVHDNDDLAALDGACRAFAAATGWQLEYQPTPPPSASTSLMWSAPVNPGVGATPGHIRLLLPEDKSEAALPLEQAAPLAEAIGQLWGEVLHTRRALWQREAEMAAGVPLVVRDDDSRAASLAERLEAVLKGGAEAVGCQAAALYLLDDATSELKLRASFGLPRRRLADPARPLRPALADLEALLGNAVVMTEPSMFGYWHVPEEGFRSCVCVPVSTPSMPLGTLWIYSDRVREFTDAETNMIEVVAGRLAADLERETLVDQAVSTREHAQQIAAAERAQHEQLPSTPPLVEGWEIAAKAYHAEPLGGAYYDWFACDDGSLAVVAGDFGTSGIAGALSANLLRGAARAFGTQRHAAHEFAQKASDILYAASAGDAPAGIFSGVVEPRRGVLEFCSAGPLRVITLGVDAFAPLEGPSAPLGLEEQVRLASRHHPLARQELILAYGTTFLGRPDEWSPSHEPLLAALDQRLALALEPLRGRPVEELADRAAEILRSYRGDADPADRLMLLFRRR